MPATTSVADNVLPVRNERGFFEIRLESIGGLGANVAAQIFAEAGVLYAGLNGSNFASYGSEKKGSPVKGFIRFTDSGRDIRDATPIERPHVLGVFHEALLHAAGGVLGGLYADSIVIVNTRKQPDELARSIGRTSGTIGVLPALDIAVDEGSRVNMAMLGALARACPFVPVEAVEEAIRGSLGVRYPQLLAANLKAFRRGYDEVRFLELGAGDEEAEVEFIRPGPVLGYETAPAGGTIPAPGNTIHKDLSASRQGFLPEFLREKCTDCAQCDLVCPDFCFVWEEGVDRRGRPAMVLKGIDYQYCKGCLKCVEACPFDALVTIEEEDSWAAANRVPHVWASATATAGSSASTAVDGAATPQEEE